MELFKLTNVNNWSGGQAVGGWDALTWIERYREPGEFEIQARMSALIHQKLPIGTILSHGNTLEMMIVESHEISEEEEGSDPLVKITGRSLDVILEQRVVGQNFNWPSAPPASLNVSQYQVEWNYTWWQCIELINEHLAEPRTPVLNALDYGTVNVNDRIPKLRAIGQIRSTTTPGPTEDRVVKRGNLHQRILEILEIDDCGIRTVRRHGFYPRNVNDREYLNPGPDSYLVVFNGEDRRKKVSFSTSSGDISAAQYLWTDKKLKNAALVTGTYVEHMVYGFQTGIYRRVMHVDGTDLDGHYASIPTGTALTNTRARMETRGRQALAAQKQIVLSSSDVSNNMSYQYRKDYFIGDLVSIQGSFGEKVDMRVVEYAEIEDENGASGHPTLAVVDKF